MDLGIARCNQRVQTRIVAILIVTIVNTTEGDVDSCSSYTLFNFHTFFRDCLVLSNDRSSIVAIALSM